MSNPSIAALREKIVEAARVDDSLLHSLIVDMANILALDEAWREEVNAQYMRIAELEPELLVMIEVGHSYEWDKATTGAQIAIREACVTLILDPVNITKGDVL